MPRLRRRSNPVAERLAFGPAQGLGDANQLAAEALHDPAALQGLVDALRETAAVVTVRAANALKKVQAAEPELLVPHARTLLRATAACEDLSTRWNLIEVVGRLPLRGRDRALAVDLLFEALASPSAFLRAFAMTGLVRFSAEDPALRRRVQPIVENALESPSAAVQARARKLLPLLLAAEDAGRRPEYTNPPLR